MPERFAQGTWSTLLTNAPILEDALVSFDFEVVETMAVVRHDVLFCQVKAMKQSYGLNALMYFNRGYCEPLPMC